MVNANLFQYCQTIFALTGVQKLTLGSLIKEGDIGICGVDVFFDAVMRWMKSQFAVLRWSQILRCAMFAFFTLRCSVIWNYLRCCCFMCDSSDLNLALTYSLTRDNLRQARTTVFSLYRVQKKRTRITQSWKNYAINCAIQGVRLIWKQIFYLLVSLIIDQSECLVCYLFALN